MCEFDMREVKGNYNQGHVLEPMRTRDAGEAMAAKGRTMARTRSRKRSTLSERGSTKWAAVASQARKRNGKGEIGRIA